MDGGKVGECGTHNELMSKKSLYYNLVNKQQLGLSDNGEYSKFKLSSSYSAEKDTQELLEKEEILSPTIIEEKKEIKII